MKRVAAVARMTLRRHGRSRLLQAATAVSILMVGVPSVHLPNVIAAARRGEVELARAAVEVLLTFGVSLYVLLIAGVAVVLGTTSIRRDINDGTILSVLSKAVTRAEYVIGTMLGGASVVVLSWVAFSAAMAAVAALATVPLGAPEYAMLAGRCLQSVTLLCIATLFSTRFGTWVAAPLSLLVFYGRDAVDRLSGLFDLPGAVVGALKFPFPVLKALSAITERLSRSDFDPVPVWPGVVHFVDYILVVAIVTSISFARLDLNRTSD